jgi:hypothetical protein
LTDIAHGLEEHAGFGIARRNTHTRALCHKTPDDMAANKARTSEYRNQFWPARPIALRHVLISPTNLLFSSDNTIIAPPMDGVNDFCPGGLL